MRILSISLDKNIAIKGSPSSERMKEYSSLTDEMHIICLTLGEENGAWQDGKLFVYPTNSKRLISFVSDAYKIGVAVIKKNSLSEKDSIITTQDAFEAGLIGYLLKRKFRLRLNVQDHNNPFESAFWKRESVLNFFRYFLGQFILKNSDSVRTVSLREKRHLAETLGYPPEKIINFPIFTDWKKIAGHTPGFDLKQRYPGFDFYVLTICRLEKVKNIPLLLESLSAIIGEFPKTLLTIVGEGSQKNRITEMISQKNLQNNVVMEEWTKDPTSYYKTTDLFTLTSLSEGWGLTIIEAAAAKCPVIMSNTGCAGEFIQDGKNGWVTKINDAPALVAAIRDAISHKEKRARFSQKAFDDLENLPDKKETLRKLETSWKITLQ